MLFPQPTYQKLREMVDSLDPAHPECKFHIENLRSVIDLAASLDVEQYKDLYARLYLVARPPSKF